MGSAGVLPSSRGTPATIEPMGTTPAATFCATLVDEWIAQGLTHAVIAPGSRSTPLALALAARGELRLHVFHDERSAAFCALGVGLADGAPAVVLCTSGTAAAHFHAAVIEADLSSVPMLVCTADRPPELRDVGAPQTIDQTRLYGPAVRWFHDPGVPGPEAAGSWRSLAERSVAATLGPRPGPVHLNLPFREPLVGEPGDLPAARPGLGSRPAPAAWDPTDAAALAPELDRQRGVIVAGLGVTDPASVGELAEATAWPVLADPRSGCGALAQAVMAFDPMLRSDNFARAHAPEVVLRLGEPPASKVLAQWVTASSARQVQVGGGRWFDADHGVTDRVPGSIDQAVRLLAGALAGATGTTWAARWARAEQRAQRAIDEALAGFDDPTDPAIARTVIRAAPRGAHLVVSSSMPVRDVEWFGAGRGDITVHSNRGANGIDGVLATATGVALATGDPVVVLIGDLAFLHDASSLTGLAERGADVRIVVVDNDGGAIFSFLPQATAVAPKVFELLYGTPHGTDLLALAAAHGLRTAEAASLDDVVGALCAPGPSVTRCRTDRHTNVDVHARINAAVVRALG